MVDKKLEKLIAAAEAHGQFSEPEHEIGDLQLILMSCWKVMSRAAREKVFSDHHELVEEWLALNLMKSRDQ